jgi:hypothetical protein
MHKLKRSKSITIAQRPVYLRVGFSEHIVPHLDHGIGWRGYHQINAFVIDLFHLPGRREVDEVFGEHVRTPEN